MKNQLLKWFAAAAAVMIGLPGLTVAFAGSAGMAICFILFFAINPLFCAASGIFAGRSIAKRWFVPLGGAALFLVGVWLFFEMAEPAFLWYAAVYLVVGTAAMLLTLLLKRKN